jgi:cell shape-determining protein MreD
VRKALLPAVFVSLVIVAVQLTILSTLRFDGVVIMLVWLWPLVMGLTGFTSLALVTALVAGVFFDTHAATPFGLTAAVAVVIAYGASRLGREGVGDLDSAAWWMTPLLAAVGGLCAPAMYVFAGFFALDFGLWRGSVLPMMIVNAIAFFVLSRPLTRLAMAISAMGERPRR